MQNTQWYVYKEKKQIGPFSEGQIIQLISVHSISKGCLLFKVGWKDWRTFENCLEEIGVEKTKVPIPPNDKKSSQKKRTPRATIEGKIHAHNNKYLSTGRTANISASGLFIEVQEQLFTIGDQLKITCNLNNAINPFSVDVKVIYYNGNNKYPIGYGLEFTNLDKKTHDEIQQYIDNINDGI